MSNYEIVIPDIPHGHGLSFKRGVADGLLETSEHQQSYHETHAESYRRGVEFGRHLKARIAEKVK